MRKRYQIILPILGLFLFCVGSYVDFRTEKEYPLASNRYFWWSSIRLDRDPLGHSVPALNPRRNEDGNVGWDPPTKWVTPGPLANFLKYSALPAFALGAVVVGAVGRLGVSQVTSFMTVMPLLIAVWYYFVGWLIDRWLIRRPSHSALC
jgi:hypothetical protein